MKILFKRSVLSIAILLLVLAISWLYGKEYYVGELSAGTLTIENTAIVVEEASTFAGRSKGLGGRDYLKEGTGMLFVFPNDDYHGFWMKDMKFPIDIIWFDKNFSVVDFKSNVTPETYPEVFGPRERSRYVLEVNARFIENYKIKYGVKARYVKHELRNIGNNELPK